MPKIEYPITAKYVRNWGLMQAIREVVANAFDAEAQLNAPATIEYKRDQMKLVVKNKNTQLAHTTLFLGESSKSGSSQFIGQYGEGLKLAMLVFAREKLNVTIKNGHSENWKPSLEMSKLGIEALTVNITKANRSVDDNDFEVVIPEITESRWEEIENMFLRLKPPAKVFTTDEGDLIDDPEYTGKIYVRGVFVMKRDRFEFGYNFKNVSIGRDRAVPSGYDMDTAITQIWSEIAQRNDVEMTQRMYKALMTESAEQEAFYYATNDALIDGLIQQFKEKYGDKAVPVSGTAEGLGLEHLGHVPVPLPSRLVALLRRKMPAPSVLIRQHRESITRIYASYELSEREKFNLTNAINLLGNGVKNAEERINVVDFGSEDTEGLHHDSTVSVARRTLDDFGKLVMLLIHEFAHDYGVDGSAAHVDHIHRLTEAVMNELWAKRR